jgi:hypothetical protein
MDNAILMEATKGTVASHDLLSTNKKNFISALSLLAAALDDTQSSSVKDSFESWEQSLLVEDEASKDTDDLVSFSHSNVAAAATITSSHIAPTSDSDEKQGSDDLMIMDQAQQEREKPRTLLTYYGSRGGVKGSSPTTAADKGGKERIDALDADPDRDLARQPGDERHAGYGLDGKGPAHAPEGKGVERQVDREEEPAEGDAGDVLEEEREAGGFAEEAEDAEGFGGHMPLPRCQRFPRGIEDFLNVPYGVVAAAGKT